MKRPDTLEISTLRRPAALPGRARPERLAAVRSLDLALAGLLLVVLILGIWHLDRYPRSWFDEGSYLETAQNLVDNGTYAATSADGTRDFAPVVAVGPTVLLPTAASLAFGGRSSLEAARIVPVIYLLFATALLYIVARALFGRWTAMLALLVACSLPSLDWIVTGRQVLGEIPAMAFLLLGGIIAARQGGRQTAFFAGVVFGLTMITKGQYLLVLPAAMVAVAALDQRGARRRPLDWYLTLIVTAMTSYALWIASLLVIVGEGDVVENFRLLRESSGGALLIINPDRMVAALKLLLGPSSLFLVLPSLIFGIWEYRRSEGERQWRIGCLLVFQALWFTWFAFASIAWPRYAFPALALNAIFAGRMLAELAGLLDRERPVAALRSVRGAAALAILAAAGLLMGAAAWRNFEPVVRADERQPQEFAARVNSAVPADQTISGWEPEISFLSGRRLGYPPLGSLDSVVRATWLGDASQPDFSSEVEGEYLIIGPFARYVGVYDTLVESGAYVPVFSVGDYELLRHER